jgi:hypothetical protein
MLNNLIKTQKKKPLKEKSLSKKTASNNKQSTIKYADKSKDQPELILIFNQIKNILKEYQKVH